MTKFEIGKTYSARSICDYNCIFSFVITARTDKTVSIDGCGRKGRRKITVRDGAETIEPLGHYSMSPVLRADRVVY